MTPDVTAALIALAGTVLVVGGGTIGSLLTSRTHKRAQDAAMAAVKATAEDSLVDQLQEELARYRESADRRATAQEERMNQLAPLVDGYRDYAHTLRSHIYDKLGPPPPPWPDGLPR